MSSRSQLVHDITNWMRDSVAPPVLSLCADAGMGKSTLIEQIQNSIRLNENDSQSSPLFECVACSAPLAASGSAAMESLQPWAQLLQQLVHHRQNAGLSSLVKNLAIAWVKFIPVVGDIIESASDTIDVIREHREGSRSSELDEAQALNQQQVFQQYINVLRATAERRPLVLCIDDAHWADESSLNLLFAAARQLKDCAVKFILSHRPARASSTQSQTMQQSSLQSIINELRRYEFVREISLPQLDDEDLDMLLRQRYGAEYADNDELEHFLVRSSGGNPLFLQSWLKELEVSGLMEHNSGRLTQDLKSIPIPGTIRAVVEESLHRLPPELTELLRYASVEGSTFGSSMLAQLCELPMLKLLQQLRRCETESGVIISLGKRNIDGVDTSVFQFRHSILRDILYQSLQEEERELIHAAHAERLYTIWQQNNQRERRSVAASLAAHARAASQHRICAEACFFLAEQAWKIYSQHECENALAEAFAQLDQQKQQDEGSQLLRASLLELRAELHLLRTNFSDAESDLAQASNLFANNAHPTRSVDCILRQAVCASRDVRTDDCNALCSTALEKAEEIEYTRGRASAYSMLGIGYETKGDFAEAETYYRKAIDLARSVGLSIPLASALANRSRVQHVLSLAEDSRHSVEEALSIFREADHIPGQTRSLNLLGILYKDLRDYDRAIECFREAMELDEKIGDNDGAASITTNIGVTLFDQSRFEEALSYFEKSVQLKQQTHDQMGLGIAYHALGSCLDQLGQLEQALPAHEQSIAIFKAMQEAMWIANAEYGLAMHYMVSKDFDRAEEILAEAKSRAEAIHALRSLEMIQSGYDELRQARQAADPDGNASSQPS